LTRSLPSFQFATVTILLDEYLKTTDLDTEQGSPLFPASIGKNRQVIAPAARPHRCRRHAQAVAETSWTPSPLFASLIPGDRHHEFSGEWNI
jgi:hypothetical protein